MKHLILLALTICYTGAIAQVYYKSDRIFCNEADRLLIPTVSFSYSLKQYEFITQQANTSPEMKQILPEIFAGCLLVSDGFSIGAHYGFLQQTIMLSGGFVIPLKAKNHHPKK